MAAGSPYELGQYPLDRRRVEVACDRLAAAVEDLRSELDFDIDLLRVAVEVELDAEELLAAEGNPTPVSQRTARTEIANFFPTLFRGLASID